MRTNVDFAPYRSATVGFDRLFDLLEATAREETADGYPPYHIERENEDSYRIPQLSHSVELRGRGPQPGSAKL